MTKRVKDIFQIFVIIALAVVILRVFILGFAYVPSRSMMPEVLPGDYLFVNKMAYSLGVGKYKIDLFDIKKDDIVTTTSNLVKRLVGVPADSIICKKGDGYLKIGKRFFPSSQCKPMTLQIPYSGLKIICKNIDSLHEFYKNAIEHENPELANSAEAFDSTDSDFGVLYTYQFKEDYYMLLGDNYDNSMDSRFFGFVPKSSILGKVEFIYLSVEPKAGKFRLNRIGKTF